MATTVRATDDIWVLDLPSRIYNACHRNNVATVGELTRLTEVEFLRFRYVGEGALHDLRAILSRHGLSLAEPVPEPEPWRPPNPALAPGARWIGHQLDVLSEDNRAYPKTKAGLRCPEANVSSVYRRRYAWSMYRWAVSGCQTAAYPKDGDGGRGWMTYAMPGSMELHLDGLNRLAHQELD